MFKLHAAKELFYAFADRSMAYNLQHIIGLTTFSTTVHDINKCSELYEGFKVWHEKNLTHNFLQNMYKTYANVKNVTNYTNWEQSIEVSVEV